MGDIIITFPIIQRTGLTDEMIVSQLQLQVLQLINLGALVGEMDDILKDFEIQKDANMIAVTVPETAIGKATDKFLTVGAGMNRKVEIPKEFLVTEIKEEPEVFDRSFSMIQIVDRMKNAMRQPRQRFRYLIMDYKKYYKVAKRSLEKNPEKAQKLMNMFVTDVMGMFTEVLPLIEEGKQLQALVGTSQITPQLSKSARELSLAYRRALRQEKGAGQINKAYWGKLKGAYQEFMKVLMENVFPGLQGAQEALQEDSKEESRRYSYKDDGRISLFDQVDREAEESARQEELEAQKEELTHKEELSQEEYSKAEDGRIKLYGNQVSSSLPPALDSKLQDIAQFYNVISYRDIMKFNYTPEKGRKINRLYQLAGALEETDDHDGALKCANKIADIVKGTSRTFSLDEIAAVLMKTENNEYYVVSIEDDEDWKRIKSYQNEGHKKVKEFKSTGEAVKYMEDKKLPAYE